MSSSSRIFIRGLPPNLSEEDFRRHFAAQCTLTDVRLIPRRRIGYVGYKTPEEAARAVKYFDRSYIRLSRLSVEIARPVDDATPARRVAVNEGGRSLKQATVVVEEIGVNGDDSIRNGIKRKRDINDEAVEDRNLREFLHLMGRHSNSKTWENQDTLKHSGATYTTGQVEAAPLDPEMRKRDNSAASTGKVAEQLAPVAEVKDVQRAPDLETKPDRKNIEIEAVRISPEDPSGNHSNEVAVQAVSVSDKDWLRSKTRRLLDLVDEDEEVAAGHSEHSRGDGPMSSVPARADSDEQERSDTRRGDSNAQEGLPEETIDGDHASHKDSGEAQLTSGRLFLRNLSYAATVDDIHQSFSPYGALTEVHIPTGADGGSKGFAYVSYSEPESAAEALKSLDGKIFQGRLVHILPAAPKIENKLDEFALSKLPLKKRQQIKKRTEAAASFFNWNSLYMSADAVMSSIADRLKVAKADLLDPTSSDAAINQAHAETHVIQETKQFFATNGVDLDAFQRRERGDTAILVKNFPYGTTKAELKALFEGFGSPSRLLMPPAGTVAIVEFVNPKDARAAFAGLAYRRLKDSVLFLEKGPKGLFKGSASTVLPAETTLGGVEPKSSAAEIMPDDAEPNVSTSTLYVRNLNFSTTTAGLRDACQSLGGFVSAKVKTKPDPKHPSRTLSMGFGFLEFRTLEQAQSAARALEGYTLDGHQLVVRAARRDLDAAEATRKADTARKSAKKKTKVIIKNLPFEATKKDVRALFGSYGHLRSVRLPKKFDHSTRGFAFADFVTAREAENALKALKNTHFLGRRLVLEFAAEDPVDAEAEIEKMQQKVSNQVDKVTVQRLTTNNRQKFNVDAGELDE